MRVKDGADHVLDVASQDSEQESDSNLTEERRQRAIRVSNRIAHNNALIMGPTPSCDSEDKA